MGQRLGNRTGRDASPAQALQCHIDAALLSVASALVDGAAADVVAVFSQIGQVAEVGEGTDYADRPVTGQALEQLFQRFVRLVVCVAPESHGELADLLDQFVSLLPVLGQDHIAQNTAQQPDVVNQRAFVATAELGGGFGAGGGRVVHGMAGKSPMLASGFTSNYTRVTSGKYISGS